MCLVTLHRTSQLHSKTWQIDSQSSIGLDKCELSFCLQLLMCGGWSTPSRRNHSERLGTRVSWGLLDGIDLPRLPRSWIGVASPGVKQSTETITFQNKELQATHVDMFSCSGCTLFWDVLRKFYCVYLRSPPAPDCSGSITSPGRSDNLSCCFCFFPCLVIVSSSMGSFPWPFLLRMEKHCTWEQSNREIPLHTVFKKKAVLLQKGWLWSALATADPSLIKPIVTVSLSPLSGAEVLHVTNARQVPMSK